MHIFVSVVFFTFVFIVYQAFDVIFLLTRNNNNNNNNNSNNLCVLSLMGCFSQSLKSFCYHC